MGIRPSNDMLSLDRVAVNSATIKARENGELVGFDGYKHRRGLKVDIAVMAESLPLGIVIGPGDGHDGVSLIEAFDGIMVKRGIGGLMGRPKELYADSAYNSNRIRSYLRRRDMKANIPLNPEDRRKPKPGRPCRLNRKAYRL